MISFVVTLFHWYQSWSRQIKVLQPSILDPLPELDMAVDQPLEEKFLLLLYHLLVLIWQPWETQDNVHLWPHFILWLGWNTQTLSLTNIRIGRSVGCLFPESQLGILPCCICTCLPSESHKVSSDSKAHTLPLILLIFKVLLDSFSFT